METKRKLLRAAFKQAFVKEALSVIVVCADETSSSLRYGTRGKTLYCIQDTAAATQNILLTAYSPGLSTCCIGAFNEDEAKKALNTPVGIQPMAMILLATPTKTPSQRGRRSLNQIMHHEEF